MVEKNVFENESGSQETSSGVSSFSGAHDYFVNNVLPEDIQAHLRRIKAPTPYINNRDQVFLLVRAGTGTMAVNGLEYKLVPNTLVNLGPFHRYRFIPDKGQELEIVDSRMNSGTYVYMIANPYLKMDQFYVTSEPPIVYLSGLLADIANDSMNGLLEEMETRSKDTTQLCFCYMMDLLGIITEKIPKTYFKQPNKAKEEKPKKQNTDS